MYYARIKTLTDALLTLKEENKNLKAMVEEQKTS